MPNNTQGSKTSVFWGKWRLSAEGGVSTIAPTKVSIPVAPTLEATHRSELVGSSMSEDVGFQLSRFGLEDDLLVAWEAATAYPLVQIIRGAAGNPATIQDTTRLRTYPATDTPDNIKVRDLSFSPAAPYYFSGGLLFDHTIAHASGVTATADGAGVQVGAVAAGQSVTLFWANPHDPAPTVAGGIAHVESDATDSWSGSETTRGVAFATATSTPAYETQTIAGPITDTWWRLSITQVTSGTFYPVCAIFIHTT